jgi:uncharacterized membrane protein
MTSIEDAPDAALAEGGDEPLSEAHPGPDVNVGPFERGASVTLGAALLALALSRRRPRGTFAFAAVGAWLVWRGTSGHCPVYDALDTGSAEDEEDARLGAGPHDDASLEAAVTIARPLEAVDAFVRRLDNAPFYMAFVESVEPLDGGRSRWRARLPSGRRLEWEAEVLEDQPGTLFAWRSRPGALVHHAAAFSLRAAPGGAGTQVRLDVEFVPPGTRLGRALARLLGTAFEYPVEEDLRRLKEVLEGPQT